MGDSRRCEGRSQSPEDSRTMNSGSTRPMLRWINTAFAVALAAFARGVLIHARARLRHPNEPKDRKQQ